MVEPIALPLVSQPTKPVSAVPAVADAARRVTIVPAAPRSSSSEDVAKKPSGAASVESESTVETGHLFAGPAPEPGSFPDDFPWHAVPNVDDVCRFAGTTEDDGLTTQEAAARRARFGSNTLPEPPGRSFARRVWEQLNNIITLVLIGSAVISAIFTQWAEMALIIVVVVGNTVIGLVQEGRAEKAAAAVKSFLVSKAIVKRDDDRITVEAAELVPGDVVYLAAGDRLPADVRLVQASNLHVMEAVLTGESAPVAKRIEAAPLDAPLGDRHCMGFNGTMITQGSAVGVVVATGPRAELGKITTLVTSVVAVKTPLLRQLEVFGRTLSIAGVLLAIITFLVAFLARDYSLTDAFLVTVGTAVALIPEGLPSVVTITLALGVQVRACGCVWVRIPLHGVT